MAQARPVDALVDAIAAHGADPAAEVLLAHWVQEAVVREQPVAAALGGGWRPAHPLGRLPLSLSPVERQIPRWMPRYSAEGYGRAFPDEPPYARRHRAEPGLESLEGVRLSDAEERVDQLCFSWGPRVWSLPSPLAGRHPDRRVLFGLGIGLLDEVSRRHVRHCRVAPEDAIARVFVVAGNGVMTRRGDAMGRLIAWDVVNALLGGDPAEAMERAERSDWWWIRFRPAWFSLYAYGFVVVSPERTRVGGTAGSYND